MPARHLPPVAVWDRTAQTVIRTELAKAGKSQAEVAARLDLTPAAISNRFNRDFYSWSIGEIMILSDWLKRDLLLAIKRAGRTGSDGDDEAVA